MIKKLTHNLVLIITLAMLFSCVNDGTREIPKTSADIFKEYQAQGVGKMISVPPAMVAIFLDETLQGNDKLISLLNDTKKLSFLIIPLDSKSKEDKLYKDLDSQLNKMTFNNLASIDNGSELIGVKVLCPNDKKNILEVVVLVSNHKTLFCVSFQGDIPHQKVIDLTKPENIGIISNLNRFKR